MVNLLILSISVPNMVMIGRHLTSFVTCTTFNNSMAYLKNWTDNLFLSRRYAAASADISL